jgi:Glycine rich protein
MRRFALAAVVLIGAGYAPAAAPGATVTFDQPGASTLTVPAGVHFATFEIYGAHGGGLGGAGAYVRATLRVERRATLTIVVGGAGGQPDNPGGLGGIGGGGAGGAGAAPTSLGGQTFAGTGGGGGGGASDVRTGSAEESGLRSRLLVAGGGGGAAEWPGGDGGIVGETAPPGKAEDAFCRFNPPCPGVPGGEGGTATAPGTGGALGVGGAGRSGVPFFFGTDPVPFIRYGHGGGGGGGGYYGGGAGAAGLTQEGAAISIHLDLDSTGGGGGSSFVTPDAVCPPVVQTGVRGGDGLVVITYRRGGSLKRACS